MKNIFAFIIALMSVNAFAEETLIYPIRTDGTRDYTKPASRVDGDLIYPIRSDGERDYTKPAQQIKNGGTSPSI